MRKTVAGMGMVGMMAAGAALAEPPQVTGVALSQPDKTRLAVVTYETDGPGIATFQFKTNGVPISNAVWKVAGEISRHIPAAGSHTFTWDVGHDLPERVLSNLTAEVTLWATNAPPPYCGVNLVADGSGQFPVYFWASAGEVPLGVTHCRWKKDWLLLRQIPSTDGGSVTLGSQSSEWNHQADEAERTVCITAPFYMGVYAVTQAQWERVTRTRPSYWNNPTDWEMRPVEYVAYDDIRGATGSGVNWPQTGHDVLAASFLGVLREKTGRLVEFDLPTEAQWEYACRAGTTGPWNNGVGASGGDIDPNLALLGRYQSNGGKNGNANWTQGVGAEWATAAVGSYLPNAWGLYDMHGNVFEWCLDWYTSNAALLLGDDPAGPVASSGARVVRGGSWGGGAMYCRSARRANITPATRNISYVGFRLAAPAEVRIAE